MSFIWVVNPNCSKPFERCVEKKKRLSIEYQ